jgi:6-pyruvoyltetrahydropterin/6-carboxytetrahydropterin synthase
MGYCVEKDFRFEAAHKLPHHDGKCARLHGHSYKAVLTLSGYTLETDGPKRGMLLDYSDLSAVMKPLLDQYLDHYYLNETLDLENPTSEEIARWIGDRIKPQLPELLSVTVEETCTCRATYFPGIGVSE